MGEWLSDRYGYDERGDARDDYAHIYWWKSGMPYEIRWYHDRTDYIVCPQMCVDAPADSPVLPTLDAAKVAYLLLYGGGDG